MTLVARLHLQQRPLNLIPTEQQNNSINSSLNYAEGNFKFFKGNSEERLALEEFLWFQAIDQILVTCTKYEALPASSSNLSLPLSLAYRDIVDEGRYHRSMTLSRI